ncbi:MAG TPA: hypothetical protein VGP43_11615 [Chitinophagaceae bacterium]|nr:hypothetical protein [Chitinophagaceae bacterium]
MKQFIQVTLFVCLHICCYSQIISIEKIKAVPQNDFYNTPDSTLIFPIFKMKNKTPENKINQKLKTDFKKERDIEKKVTSIRSMLEEASKESLSDIDFEINHQTQKIVSLNFQWGGFGAYPTTWRTYYCFNLQTGNLITLDSLIEKTQKRNFLTLVKKKQSAKINAYKKELLNQLHKKEVDKETYEWALNNVKDNCWNNYDPHHFTINKNTLTVIIECDFPHAILALSPDSYIKLQLKSISSYFNNTYKYLLE